MGFDPSNFNPQKHASGGGGAMLQPGIYIGWIKKFKRTRNTNGADQIMFIVQAIFDSNLKRIDEDATPLFETVTLTEAAAWRFADLCTAIGQTTPFNALNDGELSSVVKFKPIKFKVKHETYKGETRARIDKYVRLTSEDESAADAALEDIAVDRATGDDDDDPGPSDADDLGSGGPRSTFKDDDIPF